MRASLFAAGFLVVSLTGTLAWAQSKEERARIELEKGYALRKEGKFAEALPLLVDSYALVPTLKALINLADCEENLGKLVDGRTHWAQARDEATAQGDAAVAKLAGQRLEAVEKRTPQVTLKLAADAPASAEVTWDGAPVTAKELGAAKWVDPGPHVATVQVPGYPPRRYDVQIAEGDRRVMDLSAAAPGLETSATSGATDASTNGGPWRTVGWTAIGVGAASVAVGAFFGLQAISKKNDANCPSNACANGGDPDALRTAVKDGNLSTVFFVVGGALAAGGVAVLVLTPKHETTPQPTTASASSFRASVSLAPNGVFLQGAF